MPDAPRVTAMTDAALWLRVSGPDQHLANQEIQLCEWAERRDLRVVRTFRLKRASAFKGEHRSALDEAVTAAHQGEFQVLLVWALDRLDRESPVGPFEIMQRFKSAGCDVLSLTEPWAAMDGPFSNLMTLIVGWFANFESQRRSERIKAGLERRKAQGLPIGRQPGAKDRKKRKRSGYVARWEK